VNCSGRGRLIGPARKPTPANRWVLDLTGGVISWRRGDDPAAAELCGPVIDLLLVLYRRVPVTDVEVTGDAGLVDFWLERVGFG